MNEKKTFDYFFELFCFRFLSNTKSETVSSMCRGPSVRLLRLPEENEEPSKSRTSKMFQVSFFYNGKVVHGCRCKYYRQLLQFRLNIITRHRLREFAYLSVPYVVKIT